MTICEGRREQHPRITHDEFYCPLCVALEDLADEVEALRDKLVDMERDVAALEAERRMHDTD